MLSDSSRLGIGIGVGASVLFVILIAYLPMKYYSSKKIQKPVKPAMVDFIKSPAVGHPSLMESGWKESLPELCDIQKTGSTSSVIPLNIPKPLSRSNSQSKLAKGSSQNQLHRSGSLSVIKQPQKQPSTLSLADELKNQEVGGSSSSLKRSTSQSRIAKLTEENQAVLKRSLSQEKMGLAYEYVKPEKAAKTIALLSVQEATQSLNDMSIEKAKAVIEHLPPAFIETIQGHLKPELVEKRDSN
jgi:flagellar motility protein MotE (MotC chaperone)